MQQNTARHYAKRCQIAKISTSCRKSSTHTLLLTVLNPHIIFFSMHVICSSSYHEESLQDVALPVLQLHSFSSLLFVWLWRLFLYDHVFYDRLNRCSDLHCGFCSPRSQLRSVNHIVRLASRTTSANQTSADTTRKPATRYFTRGTLLFCLSSFILLRATAPSRPQQTIAVYRMPDVTALPCQSMDWKSIVRQAD